MGNKKKGFLLYFDSYPNLERLPDEQCGKLLRALFQYAQSVREEDRDPWEVVEQFPEMEPETRMAYCFMAGNIRRDTAVWLRRQKRCQEAAQERNQKQYDRPQRDNGSRTGVDGGKKRDAAWDYV